MAYFCNILPTDCKLRFAADRVSPTHLAIGQDGQAGGSPRCGRDHEREARPAGDVAAVGQQAHEAGDDVVLHGEGGQRERLEAAPGARADRALVLRDDAEREAGRGTGGGGAVAEPGGDLVEVRGRVFQRLALVGGKGEVESEKKARSRVSYKHLCVRGDDDWSRLHRLVNEMGGSKHESTLT